MLTALMIIAACEIIRVLQYSIQLWMMVHDTGARDNAYTAYTAFVDSLKGCDKEMVKNLLEEFEAQYAKEHGKE